MPDCDVVSISPLASVDVDLPGELSQGLEACTRSRYKVGTEFNGGHYGAFISRPLHFLVQISKWFSEQPYYFQFYHFIF